MLCMFHASDSFENCIISPIKIPNCVTDRISRQWPATCTYFHLKVIRVNLQTRTGHEGPEGELRYSSTLSLTSALELGGWLTPHPGRFTPGKDPLPIVQEAGWASGLAGRVGKISPSPGFDLSDRPVRSKSQYRLTSFTYKRPTDMCVSLHMTDCLPNFQQAFFTS